MQNLRPSVDRGVASLAVLLICVGGVEATYALVALFTLTGMVDVDLGARVELTMGLQIARAIALVVAGTAIASMRSPLRAIVIYLGVAVLHTLVVLWPVLDAPLLSLAVVTLQLLA